MLEYSIPIPINDLKEEHGEVLLAMWDNNNLVEFEIGHKKHLPLSRKWTHFYKIAPMLPPLD